MRLSNFLRLLLALTLTVNGIYMLRDLPGVCLLPLAGLWFSIPTKEKYDAEMVRPAATRRL